MKLSRRQAVALKRSQTAPINIWYGSVRSSKTFASLWDFIRVMHDRNTTGKSEGVVLIVAHSTNSAWRNIFHPLFTHPEFSHIAPYLRYRRNASTGTLFGQEFSVVGATHEMSWLAIQGLTVAYCLGDEAVAWPKNFWDMLVTRLSMPTSRCLVTCNPGAPSHHLKQLIDGNNSDVHVEKFLLEHNPTLEENYVARLKRMYTGLFYQRMVLAQWVAAEGAVYDTWDDTTMTISPDRIPQISQVVGLGIDYGTTHPTAGQLLGIGIDNRLYVLAEWDPNPGTNRKTDQQLVTHLRGWLEVQSARGWEPRYVFVDPAAASFREELKAQGITASYADNNVLAGIAQVHSLLNAGSLLISTECKRLIGEMPGYRWDPKATERGKDAPIKESDDYVDALRYAVRSSRGIWNRVLRHSPS